MRRRQRAIGARIGRPDLQYVQFPYADFVAGLVQTGLSQSVANLYGEMVRAFNERRIELTRGPAAGEHDTDPLRGFRRRPGSRLSELAVAFGELDVDAGRVGEVGDVEADRGTCGTGRRTSRRAPRASRRRPQVGHLEPDVIDRPPFGADDGGVVEVANEKFIPGTSAVWRSSRACATPARRSPHTNRAASRSRPAGSAGDRPIDLRREGSCPPASRS